jgi:hypothetical protein
MSSLPSKITKPSNTPTITPDKLPFSSGNTLGSKKNKQKKKKKSKTGAVIGSKKTQENTLGNAHKVVTGVGVENIDGNGGGDDGRNHVGINVGHEPDIGESVEPGVNVDVDNDVGDGGETKIDVEASVDVKAGVGVDTGVGVGVKVSNPYRHDTNNVNAPAKKTKRDPTNVTGLFENEIIVLDSDSDN